jgi:glycosyltransferase involved in cell wall biosynthesis
MASPTVSVILPVYNGATDVPKSVASILGQTWRDLELIVIDDCSPTDNSAEVIQALQRDLGDDRLRIELLPQNRGLAGALNHGIGLARGTYIARQDQDDISLPERIADQVAYMQAHPGCGLLGTRAEIWIGDEPTGRLHAHPTGDAALKFALLFNNPFVHSSVMMPRAALDAVGLYCTDRSRQPPEDYELWSRIARRFPVANLERALLVYREVPQSMSRTGPNPFLEKLITIGAENLAFANGLAEPDAACRETVALMNAAYHAVSGTIALAEMEKLITGAARAIEAGSPGESLEAARREALLNLRHHHGASRGGGAGGDAAPAPSLLGALRRRLRGWLG